MSLLLCRQESVKHPYYMEDLGIHLYSSQELCYVIYHHPLMVMDGFLDENLLGFLKNELDMGFTALKLERWMAGKESADDALVFLLQECNYYSTTEISRFRQKVGSLRKLSPFEYARRKADYLFLYKQYGRAIAGYREILDSTRKWRMDDKFLGELWFHLGTAYARVFQFDKAMDALDQSYLLLKNLDVLQKIYHLTLVDPGLILKERYQAIITDELKSEWNKAFEAAKEEAEQSEELKKIDELFQKDSIKRIEGAGKLIQSWKKEYRGMA